MWPSETARSTSCGVSDIVEPNPEWRAFKKQLTGQEWDYDFRRLFYTWSPDITTGKFEPWLEIASREKTCGWINPGDLWVAPNGDVHILWTERALDERLREKFFPGEKQSYALNYAVLRKGAIVSRRTLLVAEEGKSNEQPGRGRFQITPDNRLFVFFYVSGSNSAGKSVSENRLLEILPDGSIGTSVVGPAQEAVHRFLHRHRPRRLAALENSGTARHPPRVPRHYQLRPHPHRLTRRRRVRAYRRICCRERLWSAPCKAGAG